MIIGGIVGGLILFVWQSLSWTMLGIHKSQTEYSPAQNEILKCLSDNNLPEGAYMLPNVNPETTPEQQQAAMKSFAGKPWAQISYHKAMNTNMGRRIFDAAPDS